MDVVTYIIPQNLLGGRIYPKVRKKTSHALAWELTIFRRAEVVRCIELLSGWVKVKARQVEIAQEFLALNASRRVFVARGKTWPLMSIHPDDTRKKEEFKQQLQAANKRGSACLQ